MACWRANSKPQRSSAMVLLFHTALPTPAIRVLKTGVQVFQFPEGVTRGDGQVAYVAIGIAASSDEHLGLLRQLTHVLSDDSVAEQLKSATTAERTSRITDGRKAE